MPQSINDIAKNLSRRVADCRTEWELPWRTASALPVNGVTGRRYRGVNLINLSMRAFERGYGRASWMTFRQATSLGGCVRRGERGSKIVFLKPLPTDDDEPVRHVWRVWTVFNIAQIDGVDLPTPVLPSAAHDRTHGTHAFSRLFLSRLSAPVEHLDCTPCYVPAFDRINLPAEAAFVDTTHLTASQNYLSTLLHEHIHATGHPNRLARFDTSAPTGSAYAFEELIAEIGAALLARMLGLETEVSESHVAYLSYWQQTIEDDPNALVRAASAAEAAIAELVDQAGLKVEPVLHCIKDLPPNGDRRVGRTAPEPSRVPACSPRTEIAAA
ncbi:MAG: zincin-like metallopeptidase domain-containing protein [Litorimonas sp.]